mmetsp:Transcript_75706/g.239373  ORF Transcript_75706/g.239373 Transcript_75706/m.239373 type:complete len:201 (-) Transcript_75706:31-633(-)
MLKAETMSSHIPSKNEVCTEVAPSFPANMSLTRESIETCWRSRQTVSGASSSTRNSPRMRSRSRRRPSLRCEAQELLDGVRSSFLPLQGVPTAFEELRCPPLSFEVDRVPTTSSCPTEDSNSSSERRPACPRCTTRPAFKRHLSMEAHGLTLDFFATANAQWLSTRSVNVDESSSESDASSSPKSGRRWAGAFDRYKLVH